jgi:hypothetical protein
MGWAELHKLRHDHLDIFTRSVQPLLWLFIFGTRCSTTTPSLGARATTAPTSRRA